MENTTRSQPRDFFFKSSKETKIHTAPVKLTEFQIGGKRLFLW